MTTAATAPDPTTDREQALQELLRGRGLRVTRPRLAVLEVLAEGGHLEVDEIATRVRALLDSVSTQAVYDVLSALARVGLARRIEPAGSPARYEARTGDNHHHVVCRGCGAIADVDCAVGEAPCLDPASPGGFVIDEAEVTFWGLCASCQANPPV
jgi:Fur family transcriptional regulator, stress-responsive regulator